MTLAALILILAMAVHAGLLAFVYFVGRNHVRAGFPDNQDLDLPPADEFGPDAPRVAMIVPLTGDAPGMREALQSLLDQDYPNLEFVFVTKDEADPATPLIRGLIRDRAEARHVLAGPAVTSGQKNHNLLAALRQLNGEATILAFCDSTHVAHPALLRDLLRPLVKGEAKLASGFHRIMPGDMRVGTLGMLLSAQTVHLLQSFPKLNQPWGGAMVIERAVFEEHDVPGLWATNIVDDFSMGPHLVKQGIRCKGVDRACLLTPLQGTSMSQWFDWWTRQLYYMKFCMPPTWVGVGGLYALYLLPVLGPLLALAGWAAGWWGWTVVLAAGVYLLALTGLGLWSRSFVPARIPLLPWLRAYFAYFPVSALCYGRTWLSNIMAWRGISYRVGWGGRVREVMRRVE